MDLIFVTSAIPSTIKEIPARPGNNHFQNPAIFPSSIFWEPGKCLRNGRMGLIEVLLQHRIRRQPLLHVVREGFRDSFDE